MRNRGVRSSGLLGLLVIILPLFSSGQGSITFRKVHGGSGKDQPFDVIQTNDRGYLVAGGSSNYSFNDGQGFLSKFDSLGDPLWQKGYGGNGTESFRSIVQTADSAYAVGGLSNSGEDGDYQFYVVKTDHDGNTLWTERYGGPDWEMISVLKALPDSGLLLGGTTYSYGGGITDMYLLKVDHNGDTLWSHSYGGSGKDELHDIALSESGDIILVGSTMDSSDTDDTVRSRMIRVDSMGIPKWDSISTHGYSAYLSSVVEAKNGDLVTLLNKKDSSGGDPNIFLMRKAPDGTAIWMRDASQPKDDEGRELISTMDGGFLFSGYTESFGAGKKDIWLVKTDAGGFYEWGRTYGGNKNDWTYCIDETEDSGSVTAGPTKSFGNSQKNIYLIKTDSLGDYTGNIIVGTGSKKEVKQNVLLYPNPVKKNEQLHIQAPSRWKQGLIVRIIDLQGRIRQEKTFSSPSSKALDLSMEGQDPGVYFLRIVERPTNRVLGIEKLVVR